jgi:hypothetical protein
MIWIAPSEKDHDAGDLEKRLWATADQLGRVRPDRGSEGRGIFYTKLHCQAIGRST